MAAQYTILSGNIEALQKEWQKELNRTLAFIHRAIYINQLTGNFASVYDVHQYINHISTTYQIYM